MRSAARTVWTNDGTTARLLIQSSPLARRHLRIQDGKVLANDTLVFGEVVRATTERMLDERRQDAAR
eukprot:4996801-Pyramimonas_sp.AAC.1